MKLGLTVEPYQGVSADMLMPFANAMKLDHIEVNVRIFPDLERVIDQLGKKTTVFHLPIPGIEGYDLGFENAELTKEIEKVIATINEYHKEMNLLYTLAHPPETSDSSFGALVDRLQQIDTKIVLENVPLQSDKEFMEFYFKAKDALGKQLAGHCIDGPHRFVTDWRNWLDVPKELEKEIVYVHVTDCVKTFDSHLPLGQGEMPFNDFFEFLKSIDYQGIINQEIKPKGLDLESILDSSLLCVRPFSKTKYRRLKRRYAFLRPILRRRIRKMISEKQTET